MPRRVPGTAARAAPSPPPAPGSFEAAELVVAKANPKIEAGKHAYESLIRLCRVDVNAFAEFVLRDEEDGQRVEQAPMHLEMQAAYDEHHFVVVLAHPESGKTQQLVVARSLHELGNNHDLRCVFLNNGQDGAKKNLSAVKKYLESSEELAAVFPTLKPGVLWREDALTVERSGYGRDPSIYCLGFHGNILGARIDRAFVDDLLDQENTRTETARKDTSTWFRRTFLTRLTKNARVAFLTNAWHEDDLAHELARDGWFRLRYPVLDKRGRSTWPSKWPLDRIKKWRTKVIANELEFARMFLCRTRDPGAEIFAEEAMRNALVRGRGFGLLKELEYVPDDILIVSGTDLGASRKMTGGATSISTLAMHPSGLRQLIGIRSGRWSGPDILGNLGDVAESFGGEMVVENNGVQRYIIEIGNDMEGGYSIPIPVHAFYTGKNKHDQTLGIDAMASEFETGRWLIPSGLAGPYSTGALDGPDVDPTVKKLLAECTAYSPGGHPGDHLMSMWFARTWGARRLLRLLRGGADDRRGKVSMRTVG